MRFTNKLISMAMLSAVIVACGHKRIMTDESAQIGKSGVMTISAGWIKVKSRKFDIQVALQNQSSASEIVWLKDVHCSRGNVTGDVTMMDARHGDFPIWLRPGTVHKLIFTCDLATPDVRGAFRLNVSNVFDNPSDDGRTGGKVIAKDLAITQEEK